VIDKQRLGELEEDLEQTRVLYMRTRDKKVREAINKLRYVLIVEKNTLSRTSEDYGIFN
jgi:hypothetical protein